MNLKLNFISARPNLNWISFKKKKKNSYTFIQEVVHFNSEPAMGKQNNVWVCMGENALCVQPHVNRKAENAGSLTYQH